MKRFTSIIFVSLITITAIAPSVWAGINYTEYNQALRAERNTSTPHTEGQSFQHTSKYQREQEQTGNALPQNPDSNKPAGKYDHPNWSPSK